MRLVECVPNFSEGRRKQVIDAIVDKVRERDVRILDIESDADHNRSVLTFVGSPDEVREAALAASAKAIELIDLTNHEGQHPRMGAVDVVPFIPLSEVTIEDCVRLAKEFASEFASRFNVPVYLYEEAATRPERKNLANVRRGEFEGLRAEIGRSDEYRPDFGPNRIHPTAGATAVGARKVLIAYNVNLGTQDVDVAKKIARQVRAREGGLTFVKALGFELKDRGIVQVSMNMIDYNSSQLFKAFELVSLFAEQSGVEVVGSEIVGLVPMKALADTAEFYLKLRGFNDNQILEKRLFETKPECFADFNLGSYASEVASDRPVPGGGSVAAYTACLASALICMVSRLTLRKKELETNWPAVRAILVKSETLRVRLLRLVDEDSSTFMRLMEAYRLPKTGEEEKRLRSIEIQARLRNAAEVPLTTAEAASEVLSLAVQLAEYSSVSVISDLQTSVFLAHSAALGALSNVWINLSGMKDEKVTQRLRERSDSLTTNIDASKVKALAIISSRKW